MAWNTYQEASNELLRRQIDDATEKKEPTPEEEENKRTERFEKLEEFKAEAKAKGENEEVAMQRFEKWLSEQQIEENIKENPSLYRK